MPKFISPKIMPKFISPVINPTAHIAPVIHPLPQSSSASSAVSPSNLFVGAIISREVAEQLYLNRDLLSTLLSLSQVEFDSIPLGPVDLYSLKSNQDDEGPSKKKVKTEGISFHLTGIAVSCLYTLTAVLEKEKGTYPLADSFVSNPVSTISSLFAIIEEMCSKPTHPKPNTSQMLYQDVQIHKAMLELKIKLSESSDSGSLNHA
jgi:hypothetical protein